METRSPAIQLQNISQSFGKKQVLKDVCLSIEPGSCVGILGINGGGKSTLLSILAGVKKPKSGSYQCYGHNMLQEPARFRQLIAYLPQDNPLLPDLSVRDNLRLWYGGKIADDLPVLDQMQLREMLKEKVKNLSGGMKRRLAIACAVSEGQPVLILDEPTSSLDLHQKKIIADYIRNFVSGGGIAVLSTHDIQEIRMCSHLYYLEGEMLRPVDTETALKNLEEGLR